MQLDELVQDTPRSSSTVPPGLGERSRLQRVPFHDAATVNVVSPLCLVPSPVAMHAAGPVQAMPSNSSKFAPPASGLGRAAQAVPFHCSLSVPLRRSGRCSARMPAAMQDEAAVHATPVSEPLPPGLGVGSRCHLLPFHDSARVRELPDKGPALWPVR
jgi:hypothetical protein